MNQRILVIVGVLALMGITSVASVLIYITVVGGSGEPSEPISAPTLALTTPTPDVQATRVAELEAEVERLSSVNATLSAALTAIPTEDVDEAGEVTASATPLPPTTVPTEVPTETAGIRAVYRISQDESEVRFTLNEVLRGNPTTVVGKTDQVAGDVLIDTANPAGSELGTIRINARTLATDNNFRNSAIRSEILESSRAEYEFIDFVPTSLSGLPESIEVGQTVTFQVTGDLTIRTITRSVTFDMTVTLASDTRLEGVGSTMVLRSDFGLIIPNAPGVADVTDEVKLEIDFVALQVES
ncbi:MAG: YceI family protein [Anaerolineaceae bacterium]|nr:YceI family protein [Anaerolineaceae bacterium]